MTLLTSSAAVKRPTTSCPFPRALASRSRPCEPGAPYRARPSALRLPQRWPPPVPQPPHDARPRPPTSARYASDSETPGPSAQGVAASSAALRSQNTGHEQHVHVERCAGVFCFALRISDRAAQHLLDVLGGALRRVLQR